jgi:hypothetical protein
LSRVIGLKNVTVEVVMARAPDGTDMFEVVRFHSPSAGAQELLWAIANQTGDAFTQHQAEGWSTYGAERTQPAATADESAYRANGSDKPKPSPTLCR